MRVLAAGSDRCERSAPRVTLLASATLHEQAQVGEVEVHRGHGRRRPAHCARPGFATVSAHERAAAAVRRRGGAGRTTTASAPARHPARRAPTRWRRAHRMPRACRRRGTRRSTRCASAAPRCRPRARWPPLAANLRSPAHRRRAARGAAARGGRPAGAASSAAHPRRTARRRRRRTSRHRAGATATHSTLARPVVVAIASRAPWRRACCIRRCTPGRSAIAPSAMRLR